MGLFGGKTDISLTLDRDTFAPGEEVRARVEVGEADKKAQGCRVELVYKNTYKEEYRDSDGDRSTRTTSDQVVADVVHLAEDGSGLTAGSHAVSLTVPDDAPGSDPKAVEWRVQAIVDRRRGRDASDEQPVTVRSTAEQLASWAERPPRRPNECDVVIEPSTRTVRPGEAITGTVTFRATREALSARALRLDLHRQREDEDDLKDDTVLKHELCGQVELAPGEERSLPFEVTVPADAGPSFQASHNAQHWYLEGVVDRPRARDYVGRLEVVVFTAP